MDPFLLAQSYKSKDQFIIYGCNPINDDSPITQRLDEIGDNTPVIILEPTGKLLDISKLFTSPQQIATLNLLVGYTEPSMQLPKSEFTNEELIILANAAIVQRVSTTPTYVKNEPGYRQFTVIANNWGTAIPLNQPWEDPDPWDWQDMAHDAQTTAITVGWPKGELGLYAQALAVAKKRGYTGLLFSTPNCGLLVYEYVQDGESVEYLGSINGSTFKNLKEEAGGILPVEEIVKLFPKKIEKAIIAQSMDTEIDLA